MNLSQNIMTKKDSDEEEQKAPNGQILLKEKNIKVQNQLIKILETLEKMQSLKQQSQVNNFSWKRVISELIGLLSKQKQFVKHQISIKQEIISRICRILKKNSTNYDFTLEIIKILGSLISKEFEQKRDFLMAEFILREEILFDILRLWNNFQIQPVSIHFKSLIDFLLMADTSNETVFQGGFSEFVDQILTQIKQQRFDHLEIKKILQISKILALYLKKSNLNLSAKLYFYDLIFSLLNQLILNSQSQQVDKIVLQIVYIAFCKNLFYKDTQEQKLAIIFAKHKNLFSVTLKFSLSTEILLKNKAWTILALLCSFQSSKVKTLFQKNTFFHILLKAEKSIKQSDIVNNIRQKIVLCIGNLADYGDEMKEYILKPQIFQILVNSILNSNSRKLKINSYYGLISLINTKNSILLKRMINKLPIPDLLIYGLINCFEDQKIQKEILEALNYLIEKDKSLKGQQSPSLFDRLEAKYDYSALLQRTQQKLKKRKQF